MSWSRVATLAVLLAPGLGACSPSSAGESKAPKVEKSDWIEVETPNFQLLTDLPEDEARKLVAEFHRRAHALSWSLLQQETLPPFQSRIVVFRRDRDFQFFAPRVAGGFATAGLPTEFGRRPTIVQSGSATQVNFSMFQHEFTHRLLLEAFGDAPVWLSEGMATYYGALTLQDGKVRLGEQPPEWVFALHGSWKAQNRGSHIEIEVPISQLTPPDPLMTMEPETFYPEADIRAHNKSDMLELITAHYASSWALVHMMLNGPEEYQQLFERVLADVASGKPAGEVVDDHLRNLPAQQLQRDFYAHVQAQQRNVWQTELPSSPTTPSIDLRPLTKTETLVLWYKLALLSGNKDVAESWIQQAVTSEPDHPKILVHGALVDMRAGKFSAARTKLEQAHQAAPEEGEPLALLTHLYLQTPDAEPDEHQRQKQVRELTQKLVAVASRPSEFQAAALGLAATGEMDAAEDTAKQAIRADQNCWGCFETLAMIRSAQGDQASAIAFQEIAVSRAWEQAGKKEVARLRARLTQYRSAPPGSLVSPASPASSDSPATSEASVAADPTQ